MKFAACPILTKLSNVMESFAILRSSLSYQISKVHEGQSIPISALDIKASGASVRLMVKSWMLDFSVMWMSTLNVI